MQTISQIRDEVGVQGRTVLSHIWSIFLSTDKWPGSRSIHSELSKPFVVAALAKTNGSVVFESVNNGTKEYQLVGIAPLLIEQGPQYQALLLRFLEHLRHLYHTDPEKRTISGEEIENLLGLSKSETDVLYHLILSARLYSNSASRGKEGWNVGVFDESEDLPDGPLDQALETLLLRSYNTTYPIFYHDQMARLTRPQTSSKSPSMNADAQPPNVFISYSHDSAEHKKWVLRLAEKLRLDGIKVLLDEWQVGPGGDVAFFMEESIAKANRVLLICTEKYVGKMDNRKGGVGYEAVLSTGELMRDATTTKFIPVIRQKGKNPKIPRNMDTRYRINLSHRSNYAAEYEKLLRNLHGAPLNPEPPLGTNPYAATVAVAETESPSVLKPDYIEIDVHLFRKLYEILGGSTRMQHFKNHDYGATYDRAHDNRIADFLHESENPETEFLTLSMESAFADLKATIKDYASSCAGRVWQNQDRTNGIPSEWTDKDEIMRMRFFDAQKVMNEKAAAVWDCYAKFVSEGRRILKVKLEKVVIKKL